MEQEAGTLLEHSMEACSMTTREINHPVYFTNSRSTPRTRPAIPRGSRSARDVRPARCAKTCRAASSSVNNIWIPEAAPLPPGRCSAARKSGCAQCGCRRHGPVPLLIRALCIEDGVIQGPHGTRIPIEDAAVENVNPRAGRHPSVARGIRRVVPLRRRSRAAPRNPVSLLFGGMVNLHVYHFPSEESVTNATIASRLARLRQPPDPM